VSAAVDPSTCVGLEDVTNDGPTPSITIYRSNGKIPNVRDSFPFTTTEGELRAMADTKSEACNFWLGGRDSTPFSASRDERKRVEGALRCR
jgi:hypothetical protein